MGIFSVIDPVKGFLTGHGNRPVANFDVTTLTLRLFKYLSGFIFACAILTTSFQIFGSPIHCYFPNHLSVDQRLVESYCWLEGVYTVVHTEGLATFDTHPHGRVAENANVPYRGFEQEFPFHDQDSARKQSYYKWISLALMIQGLTLYIPYMTWKSWEGSRIRRLALKDMYSDKCELIPPEDLMQKFHTTSYLFRNLCTKYCLCLVLGAVMILIQMWAMDKFLGGNNIFWQYGLVASFWSALYETPDSNVKVLDPLGFTFPLVTKCNFTYFASNGNPQTIDGVCLLPVNELNEKIFAFLWFAMWCLFIWTVLILVGYLLLRFSPELRVGIFKALFSWRLERQYLNLLSIYDMGEWFVISIIGSNVYEDSLRELLRAGCHEIDRFRPGQMTPKKVVDEDSYSIRV